MPHQNGLRTKPSSPGRAEVLVSAFSSNAKVYPGCCSRWLFIARSNLSVATRLRLAIAGEAGHADTVPMNLQRDALAGAAAVVQLVEHRCARPTM
jgi:hypothetical protein